LGKRVCSHARARDSVIQSAKYDVDVIFHASYTCDEGTGQWLILSWTWVNY
jgi:hypothetical protein